MKKVDEMRQELEALKTEAQNLIDSKEVFKAKEKMEEIKNLKELIEAQEKLDKENKKVLEKEIKMKEKENSKNIFDVFARVLSAVALKKTPDEEDVSAYNMAIEGAPEKGGLTVPKDISTKIKELRRSEDALENLVNVEKVTTLSGVRVIEKNADATPFDNVDEAAEFPEMAEPQFESVEYKVKKKGGILKASRELLEDTAENLIAFLTKWIGKKSKATRNALILNAVKTATSGKEMAVATIDDLKDIFNVKLDPAIALSSVIVTNQDGFNFFDKLKDNDDNYILQRNPQNATERLLFGKYKVCVMSNKTLASEEGKIPVICGDLKEAVTIFDREHMSIEFSTEAGDLWGKDLTGIKVRERLDVQIVDEDAVVMGQINSAAVAGE